MTTLAAVHTTNASRPRPRTGRPADVRGVLFDLDGTLYLQPPLRAFMALELAARPFSIGLRAAADEARALRVFRRVREELRETERPSEPLDTLQFEWAALEAGCDAARVRRLVEEWIYRRPLKYMRACRRPGMVALLAGLKQRGIRLGVFSDYPAEAKIAALGLAAYFDTLLCATDADVNAFKPSPRGFERALERWRLSPADVLYVGDRPEVDEAGASRAGMSSWILTPSFRSVGRLQYALCGGR